MSSFTLEQCQEFLASSVDILVFPSPPGLHDIFQVFFYQIVVYLLNSSIMIGNFSAVLNLNPLFLKLNRFICN